MQLLKKKAILWNIMQLLKKKADLYLLPKEYV